MLTPAESRALIKAAESAGFAHQGSLGPTKGEAYRDNDRVSFADPALAASVWASGLSRLFSVIRIRGKVAVGLNSNIRFYRFCWMCIDLILRRRMELLVTLDVMDF